MDAVKLDPEDEHLRATLRVRPCRGGFHYVTLPARGETRLLHRELLGDPRRLDVDHRNGNTLDNRKANLRAVTRSVNNQNSDKVWGRSRFKGVVFHQPSGLWTARIKHLGRVHSLGYHRTEEAANARRLAKERELWGVSPRRANAFAEISA